LAQTSSPEAENVRAAAGIAASLSSQVMAAALTMLTILGAFVVLVLDKREADLGFIITTICAFVLFVVVLILGGNGVAGLYNQLTTGSWVPAETRTSFNSQAWCAVVGLVAFALSVLFSFSLPERSSESDHNNLCPAAIHTIAINVADSIARVRTSALYDSLAALHGQLIQVGAMKARPGKSTHPNP
jgi:hypothetical protein